MTETYTDTPSLLRALLPGPRWLDSREQSRADARQLAAHGLILLTAGGKVTLTERGRAELETKTA